MNSNQLQRQHDVILQILGQLTMVEGPQIIELVGPPSSGKTTIARLIESYLEPESCLFMDGCSYIDFVRGKSTVSPRIIFSEKPNPIFFNMRLLVGDGDGEVWSAEKVEVLQEVMSTPPHSHAPALLLLTTEPTFNQAVLGQVPYTYISLG